MVVCEVGKTVIEGFADSEGLGAVFGFHQEFGDIPGIDMFHGVQPKFVVTHVVDQPAAPHDQRIAHRAGDRRCTEKPAAGRSVRVGRRIGVRLVEITYVFKENRIVIIRILVGMLVIRVKIFRPARNAAAGRCEDRKSVIAAHLIHSLAVGAAAVVQHDIGHDQQSVVVHGGDHGVQFAATAVARTRGAFAEVLAKIEVVVHAITHVPHTGK